MLEVLSPSTGEPLGSVAVTPPDAVPAEVAAAAAVQPYWRIVPVGGRARYVRRLAQAVLDDLDGLTDALARESGRPRTAALLGEVLPTVGALHRLADAGPEVLAPARLGRLPASRDRRSAIVHDPLGVVAVLGSSDSPWSEAAREVAAALLAGNGVVLASAPGARLVAERLRLAVERAGVPEGLVRVVHGTGTADALHAATARAFGGGPAGPAALMLVLSDAPFERTVRAALWAAFTGAGRGRAAVGRVVVEAPLADTLAERLAEEARTLVVGDPLRPETHVGPLGSPEHAARLRSAVDAAVAAGARLLCGGETTVSGLRGSFWSPCVLRADPAAAEPLREAAPGPLLVVVDAPDEDAAIALGRAGAPPVASVWTADRVRGERVARALAAGLTAVNDHTPPSVGVQVRLRKHVFTRVVRPVPRLPAARRLPLDESLVAAASAWARLEHGRPAERLSVLRTGARPLARVAGRLLRDAARGS